MTFLDKYNLVELLGLENLPEDSLKQIVSKTVEIVYRRVFKKIDDQNLIPQAAKLETIAMEERGESIENIQQYISEQIPSFTDMIILETDLMKIEMLKSQLEKISSGITEATDLQFITQFKTKLDSNQEIESDFEKYKQIRVKYNFV